MTCVTSDQGVGGENPADDVNYGCRSIGRTVVSKTTNQSSSLCIRVTAVTSASAGVAAMILATSARTINTGWKG